MVEMSGNCKLVTGIAGSTSSGSIMEYYPHKCQTGLYIVFVDWQMAFCRNRGNWEPGRGQTQPRSQHLQPPWSTFTPVSPGVRRHKTRCFTPNTSWSPAASDLWGFIRAQLHV